MKLVTWNCSGAFRKKCHLIESVCKPDLLVIQECEDPSKSTSNYRKWAGDYLWIGKNKNKNKNNGIGIFDRSGLGLHALDWDPGRLELFLPVQLNSGPILLAVWTKEANSPTFKYIGQLWKYLKEHGDKLLNSDTALIAGDFNSNVRWDVWDRWWNHSDVVRELSDAGLKSFYHVFSNDEQGEESKPTLFLQRNRGKPYHIDYVFGPDRLFNQPGFNLAVGEPDDWLQHSDNMPVSVEFDL